MTSLPDKAARLIGREQMFSPGSSVLVMVSGGQDSVALLHFLACAWRETHGPLDLQAVHVNHHLRGAESDADQALVERLCARLGIRLTVVHCPVDKKRGNVQERARQLRREAALTVAAQQGCKQIALGHTADDQVETMLYRLGRYGGLAALSAMRACDPPWVRPLLGCRREETAAYCATHGLQYACDRGNFYPGYSRTAIRQEVLPAWEKALPGAVEAACRAAEVAGEVRDLALLVAERLVLQVAPGAVPETAASSEGRDEAIFQRSAVLSVSRLCALPGAVRRLIIHRWLETRARSATSQAAVAAVEALLSVPGSGERALSGGWRVIKEYDWLRLESGRQQQVARADERVGLDGPATGVAGEVPLPLPGEARWGDLVVSAELAGRFAAPDVGVETYVDFEAVRQPLVIRAPKPGDRFWPLGAPGWRKLQDVLVDMKVPRERRHRLALVVSGDHILWVCGLAMAEQGRINKDTQAIVRLSVARWAPIERQADLARGQAQWQPAR